MTSISIQVRPLSEERFEVTVRDDRGVTRYRVRATGADLLRYGRGAPAGAVLEASFRFLLDREPKESILPSFALPDIERYFPEFPRSLPAYLARAATDP